MIEINDRFSISHDGYGWQLHESYMGKDGKTGEPKRMTKTTYPGKLWVCLSCIVEDSGSEATSIAELSATIQRNVEEFRRATEHLTGKTEAKR